IIIETPHLVKLYGSWALTELRFVFEYALQQTTGNPEVFSHVQAVPDISTANISPPAVRYKVEGQIAGASNLSSNVERMISLRIGLNMFLDHPIFGGGLGLFATTYLRQFGKIFVIHSTPLWLLAEMGI